MQVVLDIDKLEPKEPLIKALLSQTSDGELLAVIDHLLGVLPSYDRAATEALLSAIESRELVSLPALDSRLAEESAWRQKPAGLWLIAHLLELRGEHERGLETWNHIVGSQAGPVEEAHLARARLYGQLGQIPQAFDDLRHATLQTEGSYRFLSRAARVFARLRRKEAPASARSARVAILSSTTTDLVAPLLRLVCFRDGIDAELYVAPYGNYQQDILDPTSGLYEFGPDCVVIAIHWRDANLPAFCDDPEREIQRVTNQLQQLWETLLQNQGCRIIQHGFDLPAVDPYSHLSGSLPRGRAHMLRELNRRLGEVAPSAVAILDLDQVAAKCGKQKWFDAPYWHLAKQYPAADALPILVHHQVALIRAGLGLSKKVVVLDLDNTLWGGVIGEDGLEGIVVGPPSASGEAYCALQQYLGDLNERGILLAVCSKNNEEDAKLPFEQHDAMLLTLDDFSVFTANWMDKPANLRDIASTLNLGIDSLVFVDDNPVERALVRQELPEVFVPELGSDPATFVETLDRALCFEAWSLSAEDRARHQSYRANVLREETKAAATSLEEFLQGLEMEAETGSFDESVLARVVQLIGKTNQFNLTSRRHSQETVLRMMASDECWTQYFKLKDRFGDNGLIGLIIARETDDDILTWEIDTWLMSCRVIGRQMERFMLQELAEAAAAKGVRILNGVYVPTPKNAMAAGLYPELGFVEADDERDGEKTYVLDLTTEPELRCDLIRK